MHTVLRGRRFIREIRGWCSWGQFQRKRQWKHLFPEPVGRNDVSPVMNTCFYFQILCLQETVSTEVLCKTEMETKREHRIVCVSVWVCPASSLHTLVTLYTPFPHLSVNCCAVKLHWSMLMYQAWRHRATGTWNHSICWPSCSVLDVQKKKKEHPPSGFVQRTFPRTQNGFPPL